MKTKLIVLGICILLCSLNGLSARNIRGNGNCVTRTIDVPDYTRIEFGKGIKAQSNIKSLLGTKAVWPVFNYSQKDGAAQVEILLDENLFDYLDVQVKDYVLKISATGKDITPTKLVINGHSEDLRSILLIKGADLNIVSPFISEQLMIESRNGGDVRIEEYAKIDYCSLSFSSGGDVHADDLHCTKLECKMSGGSDARLKGSAVRAELNAKGGSDIKADDFIITHAVVAASGGSDIYLHATESIDGNASGGSDVYCKGSATGVVQTRGGSDFRRRK